MNTEAYHFGIKVFKYLHSSIKSLSNEMKLFRLALKRFLLSNSFYSIDILTAITIKELSLK